MTHGFGFLHSSGRYDRSPEKVSGDLRAWLADDPTLSLMTFTEFRRNARLRAITDLPGWAVVNGVEVPGGDDCVIAWRTDTWTRVRAESAVVSTKRSYRTDGSLIPPQRVTTALLRHKPTGATLLVSVSHLSSHVEIPGGLRRSLRSAVWRDATRNWKRHLADRRREWNPTARLVVADWNVNLRAPWFRRYLGQLFPVMRPIWRAPYPRRGTLGRRIIDIALISKRLRITAKARVLARHRSSDHRAFRVRLAFR